MLPLTESVNRVSHDGRDRSGSDACGDFSGARVRRSINVWSMHYATPKDDKRHEYGFVESGQHYLIVSATAPLKEQGKVTIKQRLRASIQSLSQGA